jgi:hypothetical protein
MRKESIQRAIFVICVIVAVLNQLLDEVAFIKYVLFAGSLFYLIFGWNFSLIKDGKFYLENEIVGFIYATVFFANFMDSAQMPMAKYLVYFGDLLAIGLMIYMIIKRKTVKRDMLIQSFVLFLVSPIPMWV